MEPIIEDIAMSEPTQNKLASDLEKAQSEGKLRADLQGSERGRLGSLGEGSWTWGR